MDVADDEISISCQPAKDLQGTDLQYSVFTKETRGAQYRNQRVCMFAAISGNAARVASTRTCAARGQEGCQGVQAENVELQARMEEVKAGLAEANKDKGRRSRPLLVPSG